MKKCIYIFLHYINNYVKKEKREETKLDIFYNTVKEICEKNTKVAMFIDMDGTIVEYPVYLEGEISTNSKGKFSDGRPVELIINKLKKINEMKNIDLYILTLSKSNIIVEEKKEWLKKHVNFIKEENWIIINKEKREYNRENRDIIKAMKMKEKLSEYDCLILLDDDHKILKQTKLELKDKGYVYHISSAII